MQQYTGFFIMLALILIVIILNRYLYIWAKAVIVAYYAVVSYVFITVKNKIDTQYENVLPVPDAYWDKNSGWVDKIADFLFWPLLGILLFIYYKWFTSVYSKRAKILVLLSLIPVGAIFLFLTFMFVFAYGYRP
ncbi:hypothetical protein [Falsibacillus pallidus]|uniref:Uncharacterized protein n=1 Tax=Falsibacillus pallidus TaxID=493781 RepID=A0A370G0H7_9BACI|nr:hypothetical protein [Falsibacillus pallidus]RDI37242.1 hypothetical protein DFR59_12232 [Falsibacillus pallidus]